jgi:hypothetical protein
MAFYDRLEVLVSVPKLEFFKLMNTCPLYPETFLISNVDDDDDEILDLPSKTALLSDTIYSIQLQTK